MLFGVDEFLAAVGLVLQWQVVLAAAAGIVLGILVGGLPGLTTATAMAVVLPVSLPLHDSLPSEIVTCSAKEEPAVSYRS